MYRCDDRELRECSQVCRWIQIWLTHILSCFTRGLKMLSTDLCVRKKNHSVWRLTYKNLQLKTESKVIANQ